MQNLVVNYQVFFLVLFEYLWWYWFLYYVCGGISHLWDSVYNSEQCAVVIIKYFDFQINFQQSLAVIKALTSHNVDMIMGIEKLQLMAIACGGADEAFSQVTTCFYLCLFILICIHCFVQYTLCSFCKKCCTSYSNIVHTYNI